LALAVRDVFLGSFEFRLLWRMSSRAQTLFKEVEACHKRVLEETRVAITLASGCLGARPPLLCSLAQHRSLKLREVAAHLHHHAACPVLILPGANVFSRVGFKLTYLACFRFSLDVVHMVANYLVTLRIEDHE
jgi:hypothetical protein